MINTGLALSSSSLSCQVPTLHPVLLISSPDSAYKTMGNFVSRLISQDGRKRKLPINPAEFNPVMLIIGGDSRRNRHATVLLDTQCDTGIWISRRLVEKMGLWASVAICHDSPLLMDANGNPVMACGVIELDWMWQDPPGRRTHQSQFLVLPAGIMDEVDVVAGREFIQEYGLVRLNRGNFLVLMQHEKPRKKREWYFIRSFMTPIITTHPHQEWFNPPALCPCCWARLSESTILPLSPNTLKLSGLRSFLTSFDL